jgi:hypothetical protein
MPAMTIVYWRDIPAQVIVKAGRKSAKRQLPERFEQAIDRCAMKVGARDSDAYLAECSRAYSIEVMPRTAEKVEDFRALLPAGTRVYIAHIDGTPIEDMVATAKRMRDEGFEPMPHFPARSIADRPRWPTGSRATRARRA